MNHLRLGKLDSPLGNVVAFAHEGSPVACAKKRLHEHLNEEFRNGVRDNSSGACVDGRTRQDVCNVLTVYPKTSFFALNNPLK